MPLHFQSPNFKSPFARRPRRSGRPHRAGFTFMEILFAVIIMGVGMIMVAAMFPAAIKQTQANVEDNAARTVGEAGLREMQQIARQKELPASGAGPSTNLLGRYMQPVKARPTAPQGFPYVYSFHFKDIRKGGPSALDQGMLWTLIQGSVIVPSDPRYAWVPFYSRDVATPSTPSPTNAHGLADSFQLFLIPVRSRAASEYTGSMITDPNAFKPTLQQVTVNAAGTATQPPHILDNGPAGSSALSEGCYLIIADDTSFGINNGVIIRLGSRLPTGSAFWDIAPDPVNANNTQNIGKVWVYVVGNGGVGGPAQDLGIISTIVSLP